MNRKYKITILSMFILLCLACVCFSSGGEARRHIRAVRSLVSKDIADYTIEVHPYGPRAPIVEPWIYVSDDQMKAAIFEALADVKYDGKGDSSAPLDPKADPCSILITNVNNRSDSAHIIVSQDDRSTVVRYYSMYGNMDIKITGAEELAQIVEPFFTPN
jgi:hypothetical protein